MRKLMPFFLAGIAVSLAAGFFFSQADSPFEGKFRLIATGMTVGEVETVLGPGVTTNPSEVPGVVVAVNPDDARVDTTRGGPPPTARGYPTRIKPVVEGETILRWVDSGTGETILVAFRGGKVHEKNYSTPNSF